MARRKITIEEALRVLEEAGIPLQAKPFDIVAVQSVLEPKVSPAFSKVTVPSKQAKVTLFAKHTIGTEQYGPGVCVVPTEVANHLLHADNAAKEADRKMLDREQRCYVIVEKVDPSGRKANAAVEVRSDLFSSGLDNIGINYLYHVG